MREIAVFMAITGTGATLLMDLWSLFLKRVLNLPTLNYALVGRWILWFPYGKFRHQTIASTKARAGETFTGWAFHYLTGMLFALLPFTLDATDWLQTPSFSTALLTGLLTLSAPWLILQPAFGFGIAASNTPRPWLARQLSVITHLVYSAGLYLTACILVSLD
ncbi:DUF2938 family protein [Nissabacter sp. SGAir0207]|uniref:DUF2938 family protein n=1 Tax=Nissabacter sp. SGAir0207 TaxID=2126321 RepID=UPI0010CCECC4|nr:DUF2938 family protein [Nissabacter sp. SGAir0207]QCR38675.1 DUF2938 domain-containing protein [Nissabacter sp. SGAir0207]